MSERLEDRANGEREASGRTADRRRERHTDLGEATVEALVSASRTAVGDALRSVVYFTPEAFDVCYLRGDLYADPTDARRAKAALVEAERGGFDAAAAYASEGEGPAFGEYEFTVRVFAEGFVTRVLVGDRGVLLTTDTLHLPHLEEATLAVRRLLAGDATAA
jgi:hypothetical protein